MAVSPVKIVSIIGMMSELDSVIRVCGESQIFHPDDALSFYSDTKNFTPLSEKNPYAAPLQTLKDIINTSGISVDIVDTHSFNVSSNEINSYVNSISEKLSDKLNQKEQLTKEINDCKKSISEISPFVGLNLDLKEIFACEYIKVRFGKIPKDSFIKLNSYNDNPYVLFFPCTSDDVYYWGVYFAPIEAVDEVDRIFSSLYFEQLDISESDGTPEQWIVSLKNTLENSEAQLKQLDKKFKEFWDAQRDQFTMFYSKLEELNTYFGIKKYAAKYKNSFILVGWVPEENEAEFSQSLDEIEGIEYSFDSAKEVMKHSPPVILKNKKMFKPFEFFLNMYGLPDYNEIDPTPFIAFTYVILFGIMFADLGQGLLVSLVGYIIWKKKKSTLCQIMIPCGISAAVFGTLFGSVFGFEHALDPMYRTLFGLKSKPIEVMDHSETIIYVAAGIGAILVVLTMILNIFSAMRRRDYEKAIFGQNGIAGIVMYSSILFGAVAQLATGVKIFTPAYISLLIVIPVLCIFLQEPLGKLAKRDPSWMPEKWGEYIIQNAFEMFEIFLSYITNTLSFLRVGAFVLIHASMMEAVFSMAGMFFPISNGNFSFGYIAVIVFGNLFVTGLEAFLSGVQVLRLEFYEMFIRFYNGQGRAFEPIKVKKSI